MSFPNPPVPNQEYTHSNGITYIYDATNNSWEIKYEQATNTASLPLVNPSGRYLLTGGASLPDSGGLLTQSNYNEWVFDSLVKVDETSRVDSGESAPGDADTNQLWYKPSTGSLYVYYHDGSSAQWVEIGGGGGLSDAPIDGTLYGRQDGSWTEVPDGGGGEESQPFIKWHQFAVIERSSRFDYDPIWEVNANSTDNDWQYQMDVQGNGSWEEVSSIDSAILDDIGWYGSMSSSHLRLNKTAEQANYPNAKIRFYVTTTMNGVTNADWSCDLPAWTAGECDYSSAVSELSKRVSQGEEIQSEVLSSIQQIQVQAGLHQLNLDNINADQITQNNDIESLQNQVNELEVVKGALATYDCAALSLPYSSRVGECMFNDATASNVIVIGFGAETKDGILTKPIADGDIIEVNAPDGTVSRYTVVDDNSAPNMVAVSFVSGEQTFALNTEYSVYIYPQNAAGVSKDYVDAQDDALQVQITNNLNQKVSKSGDTMTGDLSFDGGSHSIRMLSGTKLRFTGSDSGGNQRTFIDIKNELSSGTEGADNGYRMYLYHLATPTNPYHAANKQYVDNEIAAIPDVDLDGYATEQYVDNAIAGISVTGDYLPLSGGELTGDLKFKEGNKADHQFIINPNSSTSDTNIYGLNGGQVRFRTSHTSDENDRQGSHIVLDPNGGVPETKIYNVVTPTNNTMATSKSYVDGKVGDGEFFQQGGALYYNTSP